MANSITSNVSSKVAQIFLDKFESTRVLTKSINTQKLEGEFDGAKFGDTVYMKRPHQYNVLSTAAGDISSSSKSDIISGKAAATVQNMLTVPITWTSKDETLSLNQLEDIIAPAAEDLCIQLESTLGAYMIKNAGVTYGTHGTKVDAWSDVAGAGSMLKANGAPMGGESYYAMNPFTTQNLADAQNGLAGNDRLIATAWENAQISTNFGGIRALSTNALSSFTNTTAADLVGALSATPTVTYLGAKDTMTQTLSVTGFTASATIKAGSTIEVTGKYRANPRNGQAIYGADGAQVKWRATVTADVTLDGSGEGDIVVSAAGIYESGGAYNNMTSALASGDVITILGTSGVTYQPSLYYHKEAFGMTTIRQDKLNSWDTIMTTKDGLSIRVTKYSDGDKNTQTIRFDMMPAFSTFNPLWAGQAYGL